MPSNIWNQFCFFLVHHSPFNFWQNDEWIKTYFKDFLHIWSGERSTHLFQTLRSHVNNQTMDEKNQLNLTASHLIVEDESTTQSSNDSKLFILNNQSLVFYYFTEKMNIMWSPTNVNLMMVIRKIRVLHDFFMLVIISNISNEIKSKYILCGNNYSSNQFIDNILFSWLDLELFFWKYNISRGVSGLQLVTPTGTKLKGQQWMLSSLMEYEPL